MRAVYTQSLKDGATGWLPDALKLLAGGWAPVDVIINTLSFAIGDGEPHPFALTRRAGRSGDRGGS